MSDDYTVTIDLPNSEVHLLIDSIQEYMVQIEKENKSTRASYFRDPRLRIKRNEALLENLSVVLATVNAAEQNAAYRSSRRCLPKYMRQGWR